MKFNLITLLSSGIALLLVFFLSAYQEITAVKYIIFALIGYVLLIFALGTRQAFKNLTSSDEDKQGNP